mgnify:CR=1 FL=1
MDIPFFVFFVYIKFLYIKYYSIYIFLSIHFPMIFWNCNRSAMLSWKLSVAHSRPVTRIPVGNRQKNLPDSQREIRETG